MQAIEALQVISRISIYLSILILNIMAVTIVVTYISKRRKGKLVNGGVKLLILLEFIGSCVIATAFITALLLFLNAQLG